MDILLNSVAKENTMLKREIENNFSLYSQEKATMLKKFNEKFEGLTKETADLNEVFFFILFI